jgi:hypothetical protein
MGDNTSFGDNVAEIVGKVLDFVRSPGPIGAILLVGTAIGLGIFDVPIFEQIVDKLIELYRSVVSQ